MIIEYKMDRNFRKELHTPTWIECGGFIQHPVTKTLIGFSPATREYKIPDTVVVLTAEEAKLRSLAIHAISNYTTPEGVVMTETEVRDMTQAIIDANNIV